MFDERELIKQCLTGNRLAEKQLYDKYSALFFGICLRYSNSREEAEDMLVTGFTNIFLNLSAYSFRGSFEGWMKRIIVHNAIDYIRKHREEANLSENLAVEAGDYAADNVFRHMTAKDIVKAIQRLPQTYRSVFNLYAIEGYAHKEIAEILDMNESTVRVYFSKAKKILQKLLKDYR